MAQIEYRFTFLDVLLEDEERGRDPRAGRARSAPPPGPGSPRMCAEEAAQRWEFRKVEGPRFQKRSPQIVGFP